MKQLKLTDKRNYFRPFSYPWAYDAFLESEQSHWLHTEVSMIDDVKDWNNKLNDSERYFLTQIFRFFTQGDIDVSEGYVTKYLPYFPQPEVRMMLLSFANRESIHIAGYSHLIESLGMPEVTYQEFNQYKEMADKHDFFENIASSDENSLAQQIAAFSAFTEGVQLFSSFVMLLNFQRNGMMKGMGQIIVWSIVDEAVTPDTEVLLSNGDWIAIDKLTKEYRILEYNMNTQECSFVFPNKIQKVQRNTTYEYIGDNFEQHVSPNHRMIYEQNSIIKESKGKDLELTENNANFISSGRKIGKLLKMTEKQKELCIISAKDIISLEWVKELYDIISSEWCEEFLILYKLHQE